MQKSTKGRKRAWWEVALTLFGDIKVFPHPMFMVYDPGSYRIKGRHAREIIEVVEPGDILLRSYDRYLDGRCIPGQFSHAGLYLGELTSDDSRFAPDEVEKSDFPTGSQMVIHAMADGVFAEDVLNFCRCDELAVLRFSDPVTRCRENSGLYVERSRYEDPDEWELKMRFEREDHIAFHDAWPIVRRVALAQLGRPYDFYFDFHGTEKMSCTEFVCFCLKALGCGIDIAPAQSRMMVFFKPTIIAPDAFLTSGLKQVWTSTSQSA
ncbi:MAG: hypothetical protein HN341_05825 [Verrucomicrobia bacterium]|jgi:hypothetical protein|nr:hypothetical protein [Verrucomicrobiota bacterium]